MHTPVYQIASHNELNTLQRKMDHALDTRELIFTVYEAIAKNIGICGLHYDNKKLHIHIHIGKTAPHQCNYRLLQGDKNYGSVTSFQRERLDDIAMTRIEALLGMMLQPLQDSLLYQKAMIKSCWDPVTRVNNKTAFKRALKTLQQQRRSIDQNINAVFIKLDSLQNIYIQHSIEQTDNMLHHIIDLAHEHCRKSDQIFRFSDDEFVILLPNTSEEQAQQIADRIHTLCEEHQEHVDGSDIDCHVMVEIVNCNRDSNCKSCQHANSGKCLKQESSDQIKSGAA